MPIWLTVLDILMFVGLIYFVYANIRNTQGVQIIKGVLVVFALYMAASSLGLRLMGGALGAAMTGVFVAVPVIFQPELRRALQRLGGNPRIFDSQGQGSVAEVAQMVSMVAMSLVEKRWGGLMVLEMDTGLEDYSSTGIRLNAICSKELLETIFYPGSSLHDGAVIIKGSMLVSAGCFLPLSERSLESGLGSRHKAGLGLSDVSDAVVVIVSEESRSVSVASDGVLYRGLTQGDIKRLIVGKSANPGKDLSTKGDRWHSSITRFFQRR